MSKASRRSPVPETCEFQSRLPEFSLRRKVTACTRCDPGRNQEAKIGCLLLKRPALWWPLSNSYSAGMSLHRPASVPTMPAQPIFGKTHLDGYLTKKLGIVAPIYVHIVDYSTLFEGL